MKHLLTFLVVFASFYASSQAVARITSPDQTICACDNVTLSSSTSSPGNSPIVRTIWSILGPENIADTTAQGQNLILPLCLPGTYDVSIINQHQNGTTSVAQEFGFITVNSNPTALINASVNSCQVPFGVTYSNGGTGGAGITASWTFESGNPATFTGDNPPVINYNVAGSYDVQLIVTNTLTGCRDTAFRTMVVSNFAAGIILPTGPLCEGEPLQFTDNSTVGANTFSWIFENGNPGTSTSQNPTASFPVGTHTITLQSGNTSIGCNGITTAEITVLPKPVPSFTVDPTTGCAPMTAAFTNTSVNATGATFVWNYGDGSGTFTGQNSPAHIYTGNGTYTPTLTMTGSNGCTASVSGGPIVLTSPVAAFTFTENNLCEPKNVTFNDNSTAPNPGIQSWTWIFGDGSPNQVNFTNASVNHDYMCGEYTPSLVIAMANGCRDTVAGNEIRVGTLLPIAFTADTILRCIKTPIQFTSLTPIACPHDPSDLIYNWMFNGTPESGDSVYMKQFTDTTQNAAYAVDVALQIDFRGCRSSDTIVDFVYIKAPVSRFSIDNLLFCDQGQQPSPLGKMVTVNDLASIYGHVGTIDHNLTPTGPLTTVPDQATDDVVVTYKWDDGNQDVIEDDTQLEDADKGFITHVFDNYGSYQVWQIIENRSTGCIDSTSVNVHVSWIETSYVFDIAGPDSVCINTPFNFTSTSGTHGVPVAVPETHAPLNYSFNMISGGPVTGSGSTQNQTFTHTYFTPGDYDVVLTTTNAVGCSATHTDHITAFALPVASFTLDDTDGCVGISYTSTATNTSTHPAGSFGFGNDNTGWASSDAFHWTINPNGGTVTNPITDLRSETVSSAINNTTTFSLFVIDGFGCQSSIVSLSANVQQPVADFIFPTNVCDGTAGLADASISSGVQPMTYEWYVNTQPDGTPDGTLQQQPYVLTSAGLSQTHTYCLVVEDNIQCPDTICKSVTVSKPVASFTDVKSGSGTDENGNFVCPPVVVNFTNTSQSVNAITSFQWHLGLNQTLPDPYAPTTSTQEDPTGMQYIFSGTYDLYFIIQDAVGCTDTLFVDDYLVIGGPSGTPSVTEASTICGQTFVYDLADLTNVTSWSWSMGDGTTVVSADSTPPFMYTYSGVQTYLPVVTLYDDDGCAVPYTDVVTILPNGVTANFTASPTEINLGTTVYFDENSSSQSGNILTWIWDFGDGRIDTVSNGNQITNQYFIGGDVPVVLTVIDDRGCMDDYTLSLYVDVNFDMPNVFTGMGSDGPNADLLLFADVFIDFEITIVNRWGNTVYEGKRDPSRPRYLWDGIDQKSGKLCQDGTYFYILKGVLKNDEPVDIHGFVTLIASVRP